MGRARGYIRDPLPYLLLLGLCCLSFLTTRASGVCLEFRKYQDEHVAGGRYLAEIPGLSRCQAECLDTQDCSGVNYRLNGCWIHTSQVADEDIQPLDGNTFYRLVPCQSDECASSPCQNCGTCLDATNSYSCNCLDGFSGTNCEVTQDIPPSPWYANYLPFPCVNGGSCVDTGDTYRCDCVLGFTGTDCQTNIDECASNPCQNGANCVDRVNGYSCTCPNGFTGSECEINIDECLFGSCQNGGICDDEVNSYMCRCADGFNGVNCQVNINECASNPCQNGAHCVDRVNGYSCTCPNGFTGNECEINTGDILHAWYDGTCGAPANPVLAVHPLIAGGVVAEIGQLPWQVGVLLYRPDPPSVIFICAGAILNKRWVSTSRYCLEVLRFNVYNFPGHQPTVMTQDGVPMEFARTEDHPGYSLITEGGVRTRVNDVTLIRLTTDMVFTQNAQPVCPPDLDRSYVGETAVLAGWEEQQDDGDAHLQLQPLVRIHGDNGSQRLRDCLCRCGHHPVPVRPTNVV